MSLIDFASHNTTPTSYDPHCKVFAIIKDMSTGQTETVCGFKYTDRREQHLLVSSGPQLEIRIMSKNEAFLLKYKGV